MLTVKPPDYKPFVSVEEFGAVAGSSGDPKLNSEAIERAFRYAIDRGLPVDFEGGVYHTSKVRVATS